MTADEAKEYGLVDDMLTRPSTTSRAEDEE